MANLFDIGKSGLQAYRQSLAVTGQNIANIDTDGYKRREAGLQEIAAGTGSVTGIQNQTGIGVRVTDIRRSFDEFLLNKARSATANAEAKEAHYANVKQLEDILLPGDANLGTSIGQFFSSLQEIVTAPSDLAPRVVALEQGKLLADSSTMWQPSYSS
jgi:flagellar hook-associated protein 1 FlgK